MSFRNRCVIAGANGPVNLTVPLEGGRNQKELMKEIRISNAEKWQLNHWRTITSAYNRSPWFEHFRDDMEQLYTKRYELLWEWNLDCFRWVCDKMAITTELMLTTEYHKHYEAGVYEDWRNKLRPSSINEVFTDYPQYTQVFSGRYPFIPNLSVLDYIFCAGPRVL